VYICVIHVSSETPPESRYFPFYLLFRPNVNYFEDHHVAYNTWFAIYQEDVFNNGLEEINIDTSPAIGKGNYPEDYSDFEIGKLFLEGNLGHTGHYYLYIINRDPDEDIELCLAPRNVNSLDDCY
jgi:hypothetical protein